MSDMGAPAGNSGAAPEPTDGGQEQTTQQQPDFDARLSQFGDTLSERLRQEFAQSQQDLLSRFEEPEVEEDPYPLDEDDDGYDEQELQRLIDARIEQGVQQAITPLQQQQMLRDRDTAYEKLADRFTEFQDQDFAGPFVQDVAQAAEKFGINLESPQFVELLELSYKAHVADKNAQQETPAGARREVSLESGAGAAGDDRDEDIQDRIAKAAESVSPRI